MLLYIFYYKCSKYYLFSINTSILYYFHVYAIYNITLFLCFYILLLLWRKRGKRLERNGRRNEELGGGTVLGKYWDCLGLGRRQRVKKSLQESREARQGRGEWGYGKHPFHICLHRGEERKRDGGKYLLHKFFLLYVRSWESTRELEGRQEGNFWTERRRGVMIL